MFSAASRWDRMVAQSFSSCAASRLSLRQMACVLSCNILALVILAANQLSIFLSCIVIKLITKMIQKANSQFIYRMLRFQRAVYLIIQYQLISFLLSIIFQKFELFKIQRIPNIFYHIFFVKTLEDKKMAKRDDIICFSRISNIYFEMHQARRTYMTQSSDKTSFGKQRQLDWRKHNSHDDLFSVQRGQHQYQTQLLKLLREMARGCKKKIAKCERHEFSLKPRVDYLNHPQNLNVSFCSEIHEKNGKSLCKDGVQPCLNCPTFNADNNHATPAFILTSEKLYYEDKGLKMKDDHDKKMSDYTDEKSSMNIPKPRSKNNYCSVCKQNYGDYLQHIEGQFHRRRINQSQFNTDILNLTEKYHHRPAKHYKAPRIAEERLISTTRLEDSDEVEIISNPNKQIKPNQLFNNQQQDFYGRHQPKLFSFEGHPTNNINYFKPFSEQMQQFAYGCNFNFNVFMNPYQFLPFKWNGYNSGAVLGPHMSPQGLMQSYGCLNQNNLSFPSPKPISYIVIDE